MLDLQHFMGAAIQPHFDTLEKTYLDKVTAINATADAANLRVIGGWTGYRMGVTRGLGQLVNSCERQTGLRTALNAMIPENRAVVKELLAEVQTGLMQVYQPVASIVMLKDRYLFDYLAANEDKTVLASIKSLFGR